MKKIIVSLAALLLLSCDPAKWGEFGGYWTLFFYNNSPRDVIVMLDFEEIDGKLIPSTTWNQDILRNHAEVKAEDRYSLEFDPAYINYKMGDVISVFVFSPDTLAKYTWSQIKADNNYLKRYDFTIAWHEHIDYP